MDSAECVTLVPFVHQVGGHTGMMKYDEVTVCKPVSPAELRFYETLTPELAQFTPGFKGVVHVSVQEEDDGSLSVRAYPIRVQHQTLAGPRCPSNGELWAPDPAGEEDTERSPKSDEQKMSQTSLPEESDPLDNKDSSSEEDLFEDHSESKTTRQQFERGNPWGVHLNRLQMARMHKDFGSSKLHKFILLENLTSKFRSPCILDIKLGTKTYHKDHSEAKRQLHIDRDAATTTATLGLRLCGMQVYQPSKGCYKCRNKYDGRRLGKDGLRRALCEYFSTCDQVRMELLPPFIEKLQGLIRVVSAITTFSFLSTSLLFMYEGDTGDQSGVGASEVSRDLLVDLRIIDFANSESDPDHITDIESSNKGCLYGLKNLLQILESIQGTVNDSS
ncbi:inositol hexakisphosphate kinase 3-like [Acanthaster planci]|uniref:Kinase n=1 Tax=Acanthaster planci TaxID=133434 RepID=A0A8B7YEJ4_ACAPL|nr:inositol hexakisphosphate kinase 3-like [Acanthaster planci]XP_022090821.1 inositol hexakisphosphate kinase 3-like [Acanthaster planci]XP_022090822.1 inositol hexakisphosphate kinase 3-like [Acanthaster planci]